MSWWRLSSTCALTSALILAATPMLAQEPMSSLETWDMKATRIGAELATDWLGPLPHRAPGPPLIRNWWPEQVADPKADAILDGFAFYLQTRATEQLFDQTFYRTAHSFESRSYFGGHLAWNFQPLRLSRHAIASRDRYGAAFESLEQWIGTPALQAAMFEVAHLPAERLTADTIVKTISDAAGQDLSWLFNAVDADVSYAVTDLQPAAVTVARKGSGMFTGRSAARVGDFDSGDALRLKVVFTDGSSTTATWDGRDQSRTFRFQGPSPIVAAYLDPDRLVAMDRNHLDNSIVPPTPTNVPVRKWAARWMVWLQHTMLSYGFLA